MAMQSRPLRRSYYNGLICGVCGGIAETIAWKPSVVRILFVLLSVVSGVAPGFLIDWAFYFVMPGPDLYPPDAGPTISG
jgi:phage shock protein C